MPWFRLKVWTIIEKKCKGDNHLRPFATRKKTIGTNVCAEMNSSVRKKNTNVVVRNSQSHPNKTNFVCIAIYLLFRTYMHDERLFQRVILQKLYNWTNRIDSDFADWKTFVCCFVNTAYSVNTFCFVLLYRSKRLNAINRGRSDL
jgi:hypothetical protein